MELDVERLAIGGVEGADIGQVCVVIYRPALVVGNAGCLQIAEPFYKAGRAG